MEVINKVGNRHPIAIGCESRFSRDEAIPRLS